MIEDVFGPQADYGTVKKSMGPAQMSPDLKYTQPEHKETRKVSVYGNPDMSKVSTNKMERQNLTLWMGLRRVARATNAFSKKIANMRAALALHYAYYNFCRIHSSIRVTPAMDAGLTDRIWEIEELVDLIPTPVANRPKTYRKRGTVDSPETTVEAPKVNDEPAIPEDDLLF